MKQRILSWLGIATMFTVLEALRKELSVAKNDVLMLQAEIAMLKVQPQSKLIPKVERPRQMTRIEYRRELEKRSTPGYEMKKEIQNVQRQT